MAHIAKVWCKFCQKTIGYYSEGDKERRKILNRSKREHEMNWCSRRFEEPQYMSADEYDLQTLLESIK